MKMPGLKRVATLAAAHVGAGWLAGKCYSKAEMRSTALGKLPHLHSGRIGSQDLMLRERGFVERKRVFRHPDGSMVDCRRSSPRLSYNGLRLRFLPTWWR